jgi:chemotaxis-related protein WspD
MGDGTCPELETAVHCHNCPVFVAAGEKLFEREPPVEYVEEQTRQLAKEVSTPTSDAVAVAVFRVGEEWLAFAADVVAEVTQRRAVHRIPHRSDPRLMGLVNIRGELQLCVSLGELLGIERGDDGPAEDSSPGNRERGPSTIGRLLVTEHGARRWVFPVDEVAGIHRVGVDRLTDLPATVAKNPKRFSRAVFDWRGRSVGYLAEDRVFDSLQGSFR